MCITFTNITLSVVNSNEKRGDGSDDLWPTSESDTVLGLCLSHLCDLADVGSINWNNQCYSVKKIPYPSLAASTKSIKLTVGMIRSAQVTTSSLYLTVFYCTSASIVAYSVYIPN